MVIWTGAVLVLWGRLVLLQGKSRRFLMFTRRVVPLFCFCGRGDFLFFGGAVVIWTGAVLALWGRLVLLQGKSRRFLVFMRRAVPLFCFLWQGRFFVFWRRCGYMDRRGACSLGAVLCFCRGKVGGFWWRCGYMDRRGACSLAASCGFAGGKQAFFGVYEACVCHFFLLFLRGEPLRAGDGAIACVQFGHSRGIV